MSTQSAYDTTNLCGFIMGGPKGYPERTECRETFIKHNADKIDVIYQKYVRGAERAPTQCLDSLKIDLAEKLLDLLK